MNPAASTLPVASAPPAGTAISVRGVEKFVGEGEARFQVLKGADFTARLGEMMFLVGPSGCGKTTLLSLIAGTLGADAGELNVFGQDLRRLGSDGLAAFRARRVGFVFQQFNLIPSITVAENVSVPLLIRGLAPRVAEERARQMLARVGLADRADSRPGKLSGGQQQRVAIARGLVHEPDLLLCDEPTAALDRDNGQQVMRLMRDVARDPKRCVIVVTHDNRTYSYADRMAEMEDGRILRVLENQADIREHHAAAG